MKADETKRSDWERRIRGWEASGLSQRAYCERAGLKWSNFDYWRRRIKTVAGIGRPASKPAVAKRVTLVPVKVKSRSADGELVLRSPSGWKLIVPVEVEARWLAELLLGVA